MRYVVVYQPDDDSSSECISKEDNNIGNSRDVEYQCVRVDHHRAARHDDDDQSMY